MDKNRVRRALLGVILIVGIGFLAGFLGRRWLGTDAAVEQRVAAATDLWMQFLRPDPRLFLTPEEAPEFSEAWARVRGDFELEELADVRSRLHAYLDFLESEYADAADVWDTGDDTILSRTAKENREVLRQRLGSALAQTLITHSHETVREEAFRASPETIKDPNPIDFRKVYEDVRQWVGVAHRVVDDYVVVVAE